MNKIVINQELLQIFQKEFGEIDGKSIFERLVSQYYEPTESWELYDPENDVYYNNFGQILRNPDEYDFSDFENMEGFTPFGDE